ncbi:hypothetical protein Iz_34 [Brucella phage Iz]|nr:hypothetical protein Iz_34 [Brucella phage Iz]
MVGRPRDYPTRTGEPAWLPACQKAGIRWGAERMKLTFEKIFSIYLALAVLTFGYIASETKCEQSFMSAQTNTECAVVRGVVGGITWPLYWTWEGFSIGRQVLKGGDHG